MNADLPVVRSADLWLPTVHHNHLNVAILTRSDGAAPTTLDYVDRPDPKQVDAAQRMMMAVSERLKQLRFVPIVCQLSHAGTSDPNRQGFMAAVQGRADVVETYVNTIKGNIEDASTPIAPSPALYDQAYWHSHNESARQKPEPMEQTDTKLIEYPLTLDGVAVTPLTMREFIQSFHQRIIKALDEHCRITAASVSDFIAIPFRRMRLLGQADSGDSEHAAVQGGVCFALGRFEDSSPDEIRTNLLTLREELGHGFQEAIANDNADIVRRQALSLQESLLHRGTVHEIKEMTRLIAMLATQQVRGLAASDLDTVSKAANEILTSTKIMTALADALTQPGGGHVALDTAVAHSARLLLFQVIPTLHERSTYKKFGQDTLKIEAFLADIGGSTKIDDVITAMGRSPFLGKAVVAMRNLLDNAIQGNGNEWVNGEIVNEGELKRFDVRIVSTPTRVEIHNGARLPAETYKKSFTLDGFDRPRGFYNPARGDVPREISLKGSRLAQTIFESLKFEVFLEPTSSGSVTVVAPRG